MSKDRKPREYLESGGVGDVFRDRERFDLGPAGTFERPSATKVLHQSLLRDKQRIREFGAEALISYEITAHPNIIATRRIAADSERTVIVMDLVGPTLEQVRDSDVELTVLDIRAIARGVLAGLVHIHSLGLVHGDITSQNLFFGWDGHVKLGDFGRARRATPADIRVDLRRLARIIYELVVGECIFSPTDIQLSKIDASDLVDVVDQLLTSNTPTGAARALGLLDGRASSPTRLRAIASQIAEPPSDRPWLEVATQLVAGEPDKGVPHSKAVPASPRESVQAPDPLFSRLIESRRLTQLRKPFAALVLVFTLGAGVLIGTTITRKPASATGEPRYVLSNDASAANVRLAPELESPPRHVEAEAEPTPPAPEYPSDVLILRPNAKEKPVPSRATRVEGREVIVYRRAGASQQVTVMVDHGRWLGGEFRLVMIVFNMSPTDFSIARVELVDADGVHAPIRVGEVVPPRITSDETGQGSITIEGADRLAGRNFELIVTGAGNRRISVTGLRW